MAMWTARGGALAMKPYGQLWNEHSQRDDANICLNMLPVDPLQNGRKFPK